MKEVGCTSACEPAACLLSLCLWGKTKVLHDEEGRRVNSTAAWRNAAGEPGRGRGPLGALRTHGSQQTHKQKLASQKTATHTHIHKTLSHVSIPISSYTHTHSPPWRQRPLWSRSLDDVVKQLHGLHDVLILDGDKRLRWGGGWRVVTGHPSDSHWEKVRIQGTVLHFAVFCSPAES